jgi:membrane-bound lytic murein transglycosylase D
MSVDRFKHLNAAFRSDTFDAQAASYLMLPAMHVQHFRSALVNETASITANADRGPSAPLSGSANDSQPSATAATSPRRHTVRPGDSLWRIARHYSVSVDELQRWNHLRGKSIKPGLVLKVSSTH